MDRDTIDVAVIYPTDELPLTVTPDVAFAAARARAYNDWLFDYCQVCPQRLKGIGIVPLQDVDMAIQEMHRADGVEMVGIQIGCTVREDTLLSDIRLDLWAEAERLNVAIAVHGSALPSFFRSYFDVNRPDHMLEASHMAHTFAQMPPARTSSPVACWSFPKLRIAFLEAGAGWVPYWMHRMDEYNEVAPERWAHISAKPSEYIKSGRVFFSCEPGDEFIPCFLSMWEKTPCCSPRTICTSMPCLSASRRDGALSRHSGNPAGTADIPDSTKRKMVLDNSLHFYAMDRSKLGRIGTPVTRPEPEAARQAVLPGTLSARV